jgi:hypothetical protein
MDLLTTTQPHPSVFRFGIKNALPGGTEPWCVDFGSFPNGAATCAPTTVV